MYTPWRQQLCSVANLLFSGLLDLSRFAMWLWVSFCLYRKTLSPDCLPFTYCVMHIQSVRMLYTRVHKYYTTSKTSSMYNDGYIDCLWDVSARRFIFIQGCTCLTQDSQSMNKLTYVYYNQRYLHTLLHDTPCTRVYIYMCSLTNIYHINININIHTPIPIHIHLQTLLHIHIHIDIPLCNIYIYM